MDRYPADERNAERLVKDIVQNVLTRLGIPKHLYTFYDLWMSMSMSMGDNYCRSTSTRFHFDRAPHELSAHCDFASSEGFWVEATAIIQLHSESKETWTFKCTIDEDGQIHSTPINAPEATV